MKRLAKMVEALKIYVVDEAEARVIKADDPDLYVDVTQMEAAFDLVIDNLRQAAEIEKKHERAMRKAMKKVRRE